MLQWLRPLIVLLTLASVPGVPAAGQTLQAPQSLQGVALGWADGRPQVIYPNGRRQRLPRAGDVSFVSLAQSGSAWVATATLQSRRRQRLVIFEAAPHGSRALPQPPHQKDPIRDRPVPFTFDGRLRGLAWLEGRHSTALTLRTADWSGFRWSPQQTVAVPTAGTISTPAGTVLTDGSWLLVWTAHDGRDDEIFWSQRRGENWSTPSRVAPNNKTPDLTPVLVATEHGALLAWSRYDRGHYRVHTAYFDGHAWSLPRAAGPAGSLRPALLQDHERTFLLYRNALSSGWALAESTEEGRVIRHGFLATPQVDQPIVRRSDLNRFRLYWSTREPADLVLGNLP